MKRKVFFILSSIALTLLIVINISISNEDDSFLLQSLTGLKVAVAQDGETGGPKILCSATVDCDSKVGESKVSCNGYNPDYRCKTNFIKFYVECDGMRHRCCTTSC